MEVNIHHAKTNLSRLIVRAEAGEEVIIARAGKPAVKLVPVLAAKPRKFKAGALKGRLFVADDFLEPDLELEALFYDGPVFPENVMPAHAASKVKTDGKRKGSRASLQLRRDAVVVAKKVRIDR